MVLVWVFTVRGVWGDHLVFMLFMALVVNEAVTNVETMLKGLILCLSVYEEDLVSSFF